MKDNYNEKSNNGIITYQINVKRMKEKASVIEGAEAKKDCVDEAIALFPAECISKE